ncbi:MAG: T9SS type A sorting domain-containing protein, partial [Candidatus Bipolaricaulaceae bacterium]
DSHVGSVPNTSWGVGKLDVPKAWASLSPVGPVAKAWLSPLTNPASTAALFRYQVPSGTKWAELRIYDLLGRLIWRQNLDPQGETARWDLQSLRGGKVASGLYLAVLATDQGASDPVRVVVSR